VPNIESRCNQLKFGHPRAELTLTHGNIGFPFTHCVSLNEWRSFFAVPKLPN
jgi:hypothetical protein